MEASNSGLHSDQILLADKARADQLKAALNKIVQWPAFRHHYKTKVLKPPRGDALRTAARVGLRSERGVLLIFDNIIALGPGTCADGGTFSRAGAAGPFAD